MNYPELEKLIQVVKDLRRPVTGCPWDLKQTHKSLLKYLIEESYEFIEATESEKSLEMQDELGDVLLQVLLHSTIASQEKTFDLESVAKNLSEKLIRRHPHVFKDPSLATNAEEVVKNWEEIKKEEKQSNGGASSSRIDKSYLNFPALFSANKIGVKTAKLNFDWDNAQQVAYKVEEEWQELKEELVASKISKERVTEEMGDFLFSGAQLARHLGIDPEDCLRQANKKFLRRFNHMERLIEEDGKILEEMNQSEMDVFWDSAKSQEKAAKNN